MAAAIVRALLLVIVVMLAALLADPGMRTEPPVPRQAVCR